MILNQFQQLRREVRIKSDHYFSLQDQISRAIKEGAERIILEGKYSSEGTTLFSLLTLSHDIEIVGDGKTIFDGTNSLSHLVFIKEGVKVKITNIQFANGNTANIISQLSRNNHPQTKLNIFRYLDGGAISLGTGSELTLVNCKFENNHSAVCGGAISNLGGYLHVIGCSFKGNTCGDTGAAIDNLAAGALTVIEKSRFENNRANLLGKGTFGAITVFPNTYLAVSDSDFSLETATAIDYRQNKDGISYVSIDKRSKFNPKSTNAIVKNPISNSGARKEIFLRYIRLLATHPSLVKIEGVPSTNRIIQEKYQEIYNELTKDMRSRILD